MRVYLDAADLSLKQMKLIANDWAQKLHFNRQLFLISGPMGVGKTQFLRWILENFGVKEMSSPTYAIHNEYRTEKGVIDHIDLYRLKDDEDLESTGFWDLFDRKQALIFIEWADRLPFDEYPKNWTTWNVELSFGKKSDTENHSILLRDIKITQL